MSPLRFWNNLIRRAWNQNFICLSFCRSASFDTPCRHNEEHNEKAKITEATWLLSSLRVFYMLVPVLASPERAREQKREKEREDLQLTQRPNQLLLLFWPRMGRGGLLNEGRLVSVFPSCKMKPVQTLAMVFCWLFFFFFGGLVIWPRLGHHDGGFHQIKAEFASFFTAICARLRHKQQTERFSERSEWLKWRRDQITLFFTMHFISLNSVNGSLGIVQNILMRKM